MRLKKWLVILLLSFSFSINANAISETDLKSAFVYNFINSTQRDDQSKNEYSLCIIGSSPITKALMGLNHQTIKNKPIITKQIRTHQEITSCDALFLGKVKSKQLYAIVKDSIKAQIVTISDHADYLDKGVIFTLTSLMGRLRFDVNLEIAEQSRLNIDVNVLRLAHVVRQGN